MYLDMMATCPNNMMAAAYNSRKSITLDFSGDRQVIQWVDGVVTVFWLFQVAAAAVAAGNVVKTATLLGNVQTKKAAEGVAEVAVISVDRTATLLESAPILKVHKLFSIQGSHHQGKSEKNNFSVKSGNFEILPQESRKVREFWSGWFDHWFECIKKGFKFPNWSMKI